MMTENSTRAPLLAIDRLSVKYGQVRALHDVTVEVGSGQMVLLLGPNGAGKTSMVETIAGLVRPASGTVLVDRRMVTRIPAHKRTRAGISLVPEGRGTLPGLSVRENLELGWVAGRKGSRAERESYFDRVFDLFPVLATRMKQDCSTLSGGEMQMLAIGRALLARPRLLLLDEPSLGLAPRAVLTVHDALRTLNREGLTMVLVEQKALTIDWTPDQTIVLRHGSIVYRAENERPTTEQLAELYLGDLARGAA